MRGDWTCSKGVSHWTGEGCTCEEPTVRVILTFSDGEVVPYEATKIEVQTIPYVRMESGEGCCSIIFTPADGDTGAQG